MKHQFTTLLLASSLSVISMVHAVCTTIASCNNELNTCQNDKNSLTTDLFLCGLDKKDNGHASYCWCCHFIGLNTCCDATNGGCTGRGDYKACWNNEWNNNKCFADPNYDCSMWDPKGTCAGYKAFAAKHNRGLFGQF
ncbi:MAG: hypothetical protein BYD32DRAFT_412525 [Podila humilis]|nr:MAG: hypothetical protein BYD32DRAFT_412525 [Podila humilis]